MDGVDLNPHRNSFQGCSPSGFHEVFYTEWGDPAAERVIVCCHGLTGTVATSTSSAARLAPASVRVICPDDVAAGAANGWGIRRITAIPSTCPT